MTFTPKELKLIQRLRNEDQWSRTNRWVWPVAGAASALFGAYWVYDIRTFINQPPHALTSSDAWHLVSLCSRCLFHFFFSAFCLRTTIRGWYGDPTRTLLLRLLDERDKDIE